MGTKKKARILQLMQRRRNITTMFMFVCLMLILRCNRGECQRQMTKKKLKKYFSLNEKEERGEKDKGERNRKKGERVRERGRKKGREKEKLTCQTPHNKILYFLYTQEYQINVLKIRVSKYHYSS